MDEDHKGFRNQATRSRFSTYWGGLKSSDGFRSTSNQITASSAGIALGAFAGLYFVPNKVLGAFGGMLAGGIVGGAIISQTCKK